MANHDTGHYTVHDIFYSYLYTVADNLLERFTTTAMNKQEREFIQREFDVTRALITEHHDVLQAHIKKDEEFQAKAYVAIGRQESLIKTLKWVGAPFLAAMGGWIGYRH